MTSKIKGSRTERELVQLFQNTGNWSAIRVAGSGLTKNPNPDVLAGNGKRYLALECKATKKTWLYLLLLNSQWIHLFWITDEVVLENFTGEALVPIPFWLAWIAISIDYLELPVMYDTITKTLKFKKYL